MSLRRNGPSTKHRDGALSGVPGRRRRRHAESSTDYSSEFSDDSLAEKKKKGIIHVTKTFLGGRGKSVKVIDNRGCHLLGPNGLMTNTFYVRTKWFISHSNIRLLPIYLG